MLKNISKKKPLFYLHTFSTCKKRQNREEKRRQNNNEVRKKKATVENGYCSVMSNVKNHEKGLVC